jgi:RNA polymerase sigma-70 factor (ECF subfamily)
LPIDLVELVSDHHEALFRCAYRLTGSMADAEDLTQQTFLIAQQKLQQLRDHGKASNWLFTVLRNCYLRDRRKSSPVPASKAGIDLNCIASEASIEPEIDGEMLQRALNQLPDEFKMVLVMFYFQQCSYKQIAEELDLPAGTVMSRLSRGKAHLRQKLTVDRAQHESSREQMLRNGRSQSEPISNSGEATNHLRAGAAPPEVRIHG